MTDAELVAMTHSYDQLYEQLGGPMTARDKQWNKFTKFQTEAETLWDLGNERETAAEWRSDELLERATIEVDRDYQLGKLMHEKFRQHYIEARHDKLCAEDRIYNNHIGMNQFHHRKGTYAALMALLYKENSDG